MSGAAAPAIYDSLVAHARREPLRNAFSYRSYQWLVDLDALPRLARWLRPLAQFRAADHLGDPRRSIRARTSIDFLAGHGIDLAGGRVLMLANARVLGYVFNPLSVYWCHRRGRRAGMRDRRGAQHLPPAALLPAADRLAWPGHAWGKSSMSRLSTRSTARTG